jgi:hypothetical protein
MMDFEKYPKMGTFADSLVAQQNLGEKIEKLISFPGQSILSNGHSSRHKELLESLESNTRIKPLGYYAAETLRAEIEAFNAQIPEGKVGVAVIVSNVGLLECREIDYNGMYLIFHGRNADGDSVRHVSTPGATSVTLTAVAESVPSQDRGIGFLWSAERE